MSTYPTTPPDPVGRPCYTCVHLYDVAPLGHAVCARDRAIGRMSVQPNPQGGCVHWGRDQARPAIATSADWIALHGRGLTGFTERSDQKFRPPMTSRDARQAVESCDARALAWEVARLHDVLRRVVDALHAMLAQIQLDLLRDDVRLLHELLAAQEPAVAAHLRRQAAERAKWRR